MCRFRRPRDRGRYLEPASYISPRALHEMTRLRFERVFAACAAHDTELFTYSASTSVRAALLGAGFLVGRGVPTGTKPETTLAMTPSAALRAGIRGRVLLGADWLERWRRSDASVPGDVSAAFAARIPRLAQFWSTGEQA